VGIKIHKLRHLKLHAKMLLADYARAIVGSINLAPGSFDSRRELAIAVDDKHVIERLAKIFHHDWKHSHPLDLTDEGLLAEMKAHKMKGAEKLVLEDDGKNGKKKHGDKKKDKKNKDKKKKDKKKDKKKKHKK
jgi:phosphatidylserine/phosphatidylglycerophosphate/cardiolipin synthase-like enzyme